MFYSSFASVRFLPVNRVRWKRIVNDQRPTTDRRVIIVGSYSNLTLAESNYMWTMNMKWTNSWRRRGCRGRGRIAASHRRCCLWSNCNEVSYRHALNDHARRISWRAMIPVMAQRFSAVLLHHCTGWISVVTQDPFCKTVTQLHGFAVCWQHRTLRIDMT